MKSRKNLLITSLITLQFILFCSTTLAAGEPYRNAELPVEQRVADLLDRMTLEEKAAQLQAIWFKRQLLETEKGEFIEEQAEEVLGLGIGHVARPSENKHPVSPNKTPLAMARFVNDVQRWLLENTRLGIPAIFHEEALHGHAGRDATSFPQAIALASTWNPELLRDISSVTAAEVRRRGGTQVLSPVLDVARDPRWGRIEETLGEDPYLAAALGVEGVRGLQGDTNGIIPRDKVIATLKHLAGHGEPTGGLNTAPAPVGERTLREVFLFPFEAAIKIAGARGVMPSYNEIDGIPSHANSQLLKDILRDEWGFDGAVVSDYFAIAELEARHKLIDRKAGAAKLALEAGVDVEMPDGDAFAHLVDLVKSGRVKEQAIDEAVGRVLHEKFMLGLFEHPYVDLDGLEDFIGRKEHRALALQAAEQAMVLLKNEGDLLPLDKNKIKSLALIGPHVDETLLGGYSDVPKRTTSILQGLREYLGDEVKIRHEKGTLLTLNHWDPAPDSVAANSRSKERWHTDEVVLPSDKDTKGMIAKAVKAAKKSDVAVVVVGDNEATSREAWAESHLGDRTSIDLFGEQQQLVEAVLATGTPTVVLLINGRPLAITDLAEQAPAIIEGWYLGQETGHAVARVLFGEVNPSGKLPVSVPRSVGHIPAYYNHKPTAKRGYAFDETGPLYPFGHGLSYTTFSYQNLTIDKNTAGAGEKVTITMDVKNSGSRAGTEVVQLYINDVVASLTRPVKELKGFKRISLDAGETARVSFDLGINQLGFYNRDMKYIVEPGEIKIMLGSSSDDIRLEGKFEISGKTTDVSDAKEFLTPVSVSNLPL